MIDLEQSPVPASRAILVGSVDGGVQKRVIPVFDFFAVGESRSDRFAPVAAILDGLQVIHVEALAATASGSPFSGPRDSCQRALETRKVLLPKSGNKAIVHIGLQPFDRPTHDHYRRDPNDDSQECQERASLCDQIESVAMRIASSRNTLA